MARCPAIDGWLFCMTQPENASSFTIGLLMLLTDVEHHAVCHSSCTCMSVVKFFAEIAPLPRPNSKWAVVSHRHGSLARSACILRTCALRRLSLLHGSYDAARNKTLSCLWPEDGSDFLMSYFFLTFWLTTHMDIKQFNFFTKKSREFGKTNGRVLSLNTDNSERWMICRFVGPFQRNIKNWIHLHQ